MLIGYVVTVQVKYALTLTDHVAVHTVVDGFSRRYLSVRRFVAVTVITLAVVVIVSTDSMPPLPPRQT
jgi:hypothetical protein